MTVPLYPLLWDTEEEEEEKCTVVVYISIQAYKTNTNNITTITARLEVNNKNVEVINEVKLLRTIVTNDIKWHKNTTHIVKKNMEKNAIVA